MSDDEIQKHIKRWDHEIRYEKYMKLRTHWLDGKLTDDEFEKKVSEEKTRCFQVL